MPHNPIHGGLSERTAGWGTQPGGQRAQRAVRRGGQRVRRARSGGGNDPAGRGDDDSERVGSGPVARRVVTVSLGSGPVKRRAEVHRPPGRTSALFATNSRRKFP